jgi:y4mF family transcriptional regulator
MKSELAAFVKQKRKILRITQPEMAEKAGVGLRFVRELEGGKKSLRMDKVNQVLALFGYQVGPVRISKEQGNEQTG